MIQTPEILPKQLDFHYKSRFFARINHSVFSIATDEISYFLFEDNVTVLVTHSNRSFVVNYSLESLDALLNPANFFRINRRCIVKIDSIKRMNLLSKSRIETILDTGLRELVSRSKNTAFRYWLDL